ncbi:IS4 family transposase [Kibdelosporangium phytohabitans]|uniref:IS4 family transposase n=1 Tax=Kibdelosporangium phytohabitans TaxID=860235 RepID=UPI0012F829E5|nr:IS4 family transposase [Kibdelosporangium phytohabitans]MBE1464313.1 hypothetical protein [Kibdelosporangium phytohabitans]
MPVTGTRWSGRTNPKGGAVALDGTTMTVADSAANLTVFTKPGSNNGGSSQPLLRMLVLVSCGTRTVLDAVFGPVTSGETSYAARLPGRVREGTIVLADRNFAAADLIAAIAATGAHVLFRVKTSRKLPPLRRYDDGSYLSMLGTVTVRVITAEIAIVTSTGRRTGLCRLVTTLLDHHRHPASELVTLYHQRWEIETAYLEIKSSVLGGRVLRARTPDGVEQEVYALLVTYQLLRTVMADATSTRPGIDPDRAGFSIALHAARDQIIHAAGVIADTVIDLVGTIGRQVLANLLPSRRIRTSPRVVKRAISKYDARGTVDRTGYKATISIDILDPPHP